MQNSFNQLFFGKILFISIFVSICYYANAQFLNAGFEQWSEDYVKNYSDGPVTVYKPYYWSKCFNPLFSEIDFVNRLKLANNNYAIQLITYGTSVDPKNITPFASLCVFGFVDSTNLNSLKVWTRKIDKISNAGMPYNTKPLFFGGMYMLKQYLNKDSAFAQAILRKFNSKKNRYDTIAIAKIILPRTIDFSGINQPQFYPFSTPFKYYSQETPDTISVVIASNKILGNRLDSVAKYNRVNFYTCYNRTDYAEFTIDSLYLSDKVMNIVKPEAHGLKVWYNKESATTGHLYLSSEHEQVDTKAYSSDGKQSPHIPQSIYLKTGINRIPIQRNSPSEMLFLQLLDQGSKLPIGSMKIY